jgi:hypothetical protein
MPLERHLRSVGWPPWNFIWKSVSMGATTEHQNLKTSYRQSRLVESTGKVPKRSNCTFRAQEILRDRLDAGSFQIYRTPNRSMEVLLPDRRRQLVSRTNWKEDFNVTTEPKPPADPNVPPIEPPVVPPKGPEEPPEPQPIVPKVDPPTTEPPKKEPPKAIDDPPGPAPGV